MMRPIHPGLAPNLQKADVLLALRKIIMPWRYNSGNETEKLEQWFESFYKERAFAFSSGRGALYAILKNLGIGKGDEVLVEGFTCVAVVDAILATGAMPIYVDIQKDFTINLADAEKKVTSKTKALILQHTFGIPNYPKGLDEFVKKQSLDLVEDMAHGIGITHKSFKLGTKGIAALFSFGRDKAFSSVSGGMVITKDEKLANDIAQFQKEQKENASLWVFQNLFHIISFYFLVLPLYDFFNIGKALLVFFQRTGFLSKPIDKTELNHFSVYFAKLSPALASIALLQLRSLEVFNKLRRQATSYYREHIDDGNLTVPEGTLLRYPVYVDNPSDAKRYMRRHNIYLGDWYSNIIDPKGTDVAKLFYKKGCCKKAEDIASHIINLPLYPQLHLFEIRKIATLFNAYVKNKRNNK